MKIRLAYGREGLEIELPDSLRAEVLEPEFTEGLPDQTGALLAAMRKPIGGFKIPPAGRKVPEGGARDRQPGRGYAAEKLLLAVNVHCGCQSLGGRDYL